MRPCFLLDVHWGLGEGKARMPAVQTDVFGAACAAATGINKDSYMFTIFGITIIMMVILQRRRHMIPPIFIQLYYSIFSASSISRWTSNALSPLVNMSKSSLRPFPSSVCT